MVTAVGAVPCFTPGTLIATPTGERPVEGLVPGDRVITRDSGVQVIRWTGDAPVEASFLSRHSNLSPVLIRQGALGHGLPERDMTVSPNHRMLIANERTSLFFGEHEVLVAAKHLLGSEGVTEAAAKATRYIHFMFDRHEVVLSDGTWSESFQPGDQTLGAMGEAQKAEIFTLFPELRVASGGENYPAARRTLKRHEALLLAG